MTGSTGSDGPKGRAGATGHTGREGGFGPPGQTNYLQHYHTNMEVCMSIPILSSNLTHLFTLI